MIQWDMNMQSQILNFGEYTCMHAMHKVYAGHQKCDDNYRDII